MLTMCLGYTPAKITSRRGRSPTSMRRTVARPGGHRGVGGRAGLGCGAGAGAPGTTSRSFRRATRATTRGRNGSHPSGPNRFFKSCRRRPTLRSNRQTRVQSSSRGDGRARTTGLKVVSGWETMSPVPNAAEA